VQQLAAGVRCQYWGDPGDGHHQGEEVGGGGTVVEVTDHGSGVHDADAAGEALHEAQHDERPDGRDENAEDRCSHIQRHASEDWPPAAVGVADRPGHELAQSEADEAGGQGELRG